MSQEIFPIENPLSYECLVRTYDIGHSTLRILVRKIDNRSDKVYINFTSVIYFSGHLRWTGASFRHGSEDELQSIISVAEHKLPSSPPLKLFMVNRLDVEPIKIVAIKALLETK